MASRTASSALTPWAAACQGSRADGTSGRAWPSSGRRAGRATCGSPKLCMHLNKGATYIDVWNGKRWQTEPTASACTAAPSLCGRVATLVSGESARSKRNATLPLLCGGDGYDDERTVLAVGAGGELHPVRSTDLRVDWYEDPVARLRALWLMWQTVKADYRLRALNPGRL
jgi:hypothetical protein